MKRAIGYARVSTAQQEKDGTSLETQTMEIRKRMTDRGYQFLGIMTEDHTGTELDERPTLTKLRDMVRKGEVDTVIVWTFDRLARNMVHQGVILYETEKAGVSVESVKENFDDTLEGKLLRQVAAYIAEKEHGRIKERTQAGRLRRVEHHKPLFSGHALFGYLVNEDRSGYVENPETAPVVRRVFTMAANGVTIREICRILDKEGTPTPGGGAMWGVKTVRTILENPAYWGKAVGMRWKRQRIQSRKGTFYYGTRVMAEGGIPFPEGVIPALVTEDIALRAQETRYTRGGQNRRIHPKRLLDNGFVYCGNCGYQCQSHYKNQYAYYVCNRRRIHPTAPQCHVSYNAPALEEKMWAEFVETLDHPEYTMAFLLDQYNQKHDDLQRHIAHMQEEDKELQDFIRQLVYAQSDVVRAQMNLSIEQKQAAIDELTKMRQKKEQEVRDAVDAVDRAQTNLRQSALMTREGDIEERQLLFRLLGVRVLVYPKDSGKEPELQVHPWVSGMDTTSKSSPHSEKDTTSSSCPHTANPLEPLIIRLRMR